MCCRINGPDRGPHRRRLVQSLPGDRDPRGGHGRIERLGPGDPDRSEQYKTTEAEREEEPAPTCSTQPQANDVLRKALGWGRGCVDYFVRGTK